MSLKSIAIGFALAGSLLLSSCGWGSSDEDEGPRLPTITLSETDTSPSLELEVGQEMHVTLPAAAGTGYVWSLNQDASTVLANRGEPVYMARPALRNMMADGGTNTWVFRAMAPGTDTLSFIYHRPWNAENPDKVLMWSVNVRPRGN